MASKTSSAPKSSQPTPYLEELAARVQANDNLILKKRNADKGHILHRIRLMLLAFDKISKDPVPDDPKERLLYMKRRFFYLDHLFRCHYAMGNDTHFNYALRAAGLSLRYYRKISKLDMYLRYRDIRTSKNDKRSSKEAAHAPMDRRTDGDIERYITGKACHPDESRDLPPKRPEDSGFRWYDNLQKCSIKTT